MTLNELYPNVIDDGAILYAMINLDLPWNADIGGSELKALDMSFINLYGNRILTSFITKNHNRIDKIHKMIADKYRDDWTRLYKAFTEDYDPLHNYDGTESYTETTTTSGTMNYGKSTNVTNSGSNDTSEFVNGFNSTNSVPVGNTDNTLSNSGTSTDSGTDTSSGTETKTTTLTKGGNLGITTSQQMLTSEYDFREKYAFWNTIFKTIVNEMTIKIYE